MDHMKHILSYARRAVDDYDMIREGDRVVVVSRVMALNDISDILN